MYLRHGMTNIADTVPNMSINKLYLQANEYFKNNESSTERQEVLNSGTCAEYKP